MLIVLGGLAAIPTEPYESALIDGASFWQLFRYITLPLIAPFLFVAAMIRTDRRAEELRHHLRDHAGRARARRRRRSTSISTASPSPSTTSATPRRSRGVLRAHRGARRCHALSAPAHALERDRRRRMSLRQILGKIGLCVRGVRHRVAGDPVLPLDAVALAQERDRQRRLSAGLHPGPLRLAELRRRCSPRTASSPISSTADRHRRGDAVRARWSACRPATASRACRRTSPRS